MTGVVGLVLAAGAGRRMGRPKALLRDADGLPWVARAVAVLRDAGCAPVLVVLGAAADEARPLVPDGVTVVEAADWAEGMGASLRAGLRAASGLPEADAALVTLVDLPDVTAAVAARLLAAARGPASLLRAGYDGVPGHPVLLGREHWPALLGSLGGDVGARDLLAAHGALVECGDLATGRDQDTPG